MDDRKNSKLVINESSFIQQTRETMSVVNKIIEGEAADQSLQNPDKKTSAIENIKSAGTNGRAIGRLAIKNSGLHERDK